VLTKIKKTKRAKGHPSLSFSSVRGKSWETMKIKTAVSQTNNIMVKVALIIYYSLIS
jgi:hypothetical protein